MRFWHKLCVVCVLAGPVQAQSYSCVGVDPAWTLALSQDTARFDYIGAAEMTIPQVSRAEGRTWPLAMTLISADYSSTAIVLLHDRSCSIDGESHPVEAQVLTQRQDLPVLLTGCCAAMASDLPDQ